MPIARFRNAMLGAALVVFAGCAGSGPGPATLPGPSDAALRDFLSESPSAAAIAEAARREGLLTSSEPRVEAVWLTMAELGIGDVAELERRLAPTVEHAPVLLAALERRIRGSKQGDAAHWVAVALLALDLERDTLDLSGLGRLPDWDERYVEHVLALRELARRGELEAAAVALASGPFVEQVALGLPLEPDELPTATVRRPEGYWPVFPRPGARAVTGVTALEREAELAAGGHRWLARRAGTATVDEAIAEAPAYRREEDGTLVALEKQVDVAAGSQVRVAVEVPGHGPLVWNAEDELVLLPRDCCTVTERPDGDWWLRLGEGPGAGGWIQAPSAVIGLEFPAYRRWMEQVVAESRRSGIGRLGSGGTLDLEGGARIPYWTEGDATDVSDTRPPLVVLHGGPGIGSAYLREPLNELLAGDRLLLFYDQRGSGYSTGAEDPAWLTMDWMVTDLDYLRRRAEVERIDLLAHSFGGLLALHYAIEHPGHVRRIVLIDPDPATRQGWETFRDRVAARTAPADAAGIAAIEARDGWADDPEAMTRWLALRMRAYVADPERAPAPEVRFDEVVLPNYRRAGAALRADLGDWDLRPALRRIEAPVLVVSGSATVFDPAAHRELAEALPRGRLVVLDGAGHFPFVETPEDLAARALEFLRGTADEGQSASSLRAAAPGKISR